MQIVGVVLGVADHKPAGSILQLTAAGLVRGGRKKLTSGIDHGPSHVLHRGVLDTFGLTRLTDRTRDYLDECLAYRWTSGTDSPPATLSVRSTCSAAFVRGPPSPSGGDSQHSAASGRGALMATFLEEDPRTPDIRINLVVGHRAFPVLDDAFGGPDVADGE